jgi:hypothetical protein
MYTTCYKLWQPVWKMPPHFFSQNVIAITTKFMWMIHRCFAIIWLFFQKVSFIFTIHFPMLSKMLHFDVIKFPALTSTLRVLKKTETLRKNCLIFAKDVYIIHVNLNVTGTTFSEKNLQTLLSYHPLYDQTNLWNQASISLSVFSLYSNIQDYWNDAKQREVVFRNYKVLHYIYC